MNKNRDNINPLILTRGYFSDIKYTNYTSMDYSSSQNWYYNCTYRLLPNAFNGRHRILHLENMMVSLALRSGSMMYGGFCAKNSITIASIEHIDDKFCFNGVKLKQGDIIFFDDSSQFNLINNKAVEFSVITIPKDSISSIDFNLLFNHTIQDIDSILSKSLHSIWDDFAKNSNPSTNYLYAENSIINTIISLINIQVPKLSKLTMGEKIALEIRQDAIEHMDCKIDIQALSQKYQISQRSLQQSFKSLYGFSPKQFLQKLKLNHTYNELLNNNPKETTVMRVAFKWGFLHMGNFNTYYKKLFGENPSYTLKRQKELPTSMDDKCALRTEEID